MPIKQDKRSIHPIIKHKSINHFKSNENCINKSVTEYKRVWIYYIMFQHNGGLAPHEYGKKYMQGGGKHLLILQEYVYELQGLCVRD